METLRINSWAARYHGSNLTDVTARLQLPARASLSDLPPELVLHIVEAIFDCHGEDWLNGYEEPEWTEDIDERFYFTRFDVWRDVANLAATCKGLYVCITPTLYRKDIDHASSSALLRSAKTGIVSAITKSLLYGADVNRTDQTELDIQHSGYFVERFNIPSHMTSLHWAAYHHHLDVIELLLRQAADVSLRDTSLEKWPSDKMECDTYVQARSYFKQSMLDSWMSEALCDGANVLYFLLIDSRAKQERNQSRLSAATLLIQAGASLTTHTGMQLNALHQASTNRDHEMAQLLLEQENKPNVDVRDLFGNTPLHHVAMCLSFRSGNPLPVIQLLLKHGADINATNASGLTPLQECCRSGGKYSTWWRPGRRDVYQCIIRAFVEAGASLLPFSNIIDGISPPQENQRDPEWVDAVARQFFDTDRDTSIAVSTGEVQEAKKRAMYMGMYRRLHQHQQDGQAGLEMDHSIPYWTLQRWEVFWDAKLLEETVLASLSKDGREWIEANTAVEYETA